jgi:hypothetical protein
MGYVPYVGFATSSCATVMTHFGIYKRRRKKKKKKKKKVITVEGLK